MMARGAFGIIGGGAIAALAITVSGQTISFRGEPEPVAAEIVGVTLAGVEARVSGVPVVISLDQVRGVTGEAGDQFAGIRTVAERLWRARSRIERGDLAGAEPLLEELAPRFVAITGPTASIVYEGLARCRLARGARIAAIPVWLDWAAARGQPEQRTSWRGGAIGGGVVIDSSYDVIPDLPPIWTNAQTPIDAITSALAPRANDPDPIIRDLARLYLAAARYEVGAGTADLLAQPIASDGTARGHRGIRLVRDVVMARVGDDAERARAMESLENRLREIDVEPWVEAWCRLGIGRALQRSTDPKEKRRGIVEMLHVPARLSGHVPELAQLAIAHAAIALDDLSDARGASAVVVELDRAWTSSGSGTPLAWSRLDTIRTRPVLPSGPNNGVPNTGVSTP